MKQRIRLTESDLHRIVKSSLKRILKETEEYSDDDLDEFMSEFEEQGTSFDVTQKRFVIDGDHDYYETVVDEKNLTKKEAWEVFKNAAINAAKEAFSNNKLTYNCRQFSYLCWPEVRTKISSIYGNKIVRCPYDDVRSIASSYYRIVNNHINITWEEFCKNFLNYAKRTFFSRKYDIMPY